MKFTRGRRVRTCPGFGVLKMNHQLVVAACVRVCRHCCLLARERQLPWRRKLVLVGSGREGRLPGVGLALTLTPLSKHLLSKDGLLLLLWLWLRLLLLLLLLRMLLLEWRNSPRLFGLPSAELLGRAKFLQCMEYKTGKPLCND